MLALTRKKGESVLLSGKFGIVEIKLLDVRGGSRALIGVQAPSDVKVLRKELSRSKE